MTCSSKTEVENKGIRSSAMTDESYTSELQIKRRDSFDWCRVSLTAIEVDERRLGLNDLGEDKLRSLDGTFLSLDRARILCGSGIAWARSNLKIASGIVVKIYLLDGELSSGHERGVCHAVALSIARSLKNSIHPMILLTSEWEETPIA